MKNILIFCAIVLCSISCVRNIDNTFTVNVEKIYIDEEQDVPILIIGDNEAGVEIKSDIPVHAIYALLEEKEEIVLSSNKNDVYMYAKDNLK